VLQKTPESHHETLPTTAVIQGIHTRTTSAGAPHGGSLVDLMVKDGWG